MKLRIQGNRLRLRLTQGEVRTLADTGRVVCAISFGRGDVLQYSLESSSQAEEVTALFEDRAIRVMIPAAMAAEWTSSDRVGLEGTATGAPEVLVEKDFQCLHKDEEPGAYPNPLA